MLMRRSVLTCVLSCALGLAIAGLGEAQPRIQPPGGGGGGGQPAPAPAAGIIKGTTLELTMQMLKEAGYTDVETYQAQSGNTHVSGRIQNTLVSVLHFFCRDDKTCPVISYLVNFGQQDSIDANYMNAWNTRKLYGRLYRANNNLMFSVDVMLVDVSPQLIRHMAQMYGRLLKDLYEFKPDQN